nr:hypothetical protein [Tanacetum cinerariifolium]
MMEDEVKGELNMDSGEMGLMWLYLWSLFELLVNGLLIQLMISFWENGNTPIIDKIDKLECQILDGKLMFMDDDENPIIPMGNVDCDSDSESEVEVVFDETADLMVLTSFNGGSDTGYDTIARWNNGGNKTG